MIGRSIGDFCRTVSIEIDQIIQEGKKERDEEGHEER